MNGYTVKKTYPRPPPTMITTVGLEEDMLAHCHVPGISNERRFLVDPCKIYILLGV